MRFEAVTLHAFGPFKGERLVLAPGMNVVYGPNEAGKSTLHAALFAGLCGRRRARGQPRPEDRAFTDRHRPWDGDGWAVSTVVALEDGRRFELRHDLDGGVDCRATDADLGRDCSDEIMHEGAPDGSRWLGLDRRSFVATACVRQAEILSVRDDPGLLREHLQRAAATAGTDATAAEALERIERFRREHVGTDRANAARPLRGAIDALEAARETLRQARAQHLEYLVLAEHVQALEGKAREAQMRLRFVRAQRAAAEADECERHVARAQALAAANPDGPPRCMDEQDALAQAVAGAIGSWETRPEVPPVAGETVLELRRHLDALPTLAPGDLEVHPDVAAAHQTYQTARATLQHHERERPPDPEFPAVRSATEQELRDLARDLSAPEPTIEPGFEEHLEQARAEASRPHNQGPRVPLLVASVLLLVVGLVYLPWGVIGVGAGAVLLVWTLANTGERARVRALERLRSLEASLTATQLAAEQGRQRMAAARRRAAELDLPADAAEVTLLAGQLARALAAERDLSRWATTQDARTQDVRAAEVGLAEALRRRGCTVGHDLDQAVDEYRSSCQARSVAAADRQQIDARLADREQLEAAAADASRRRDDAAARLRAAAERCGITGEDPEALCVGLSAWQRRHAATIATAQQAAADWAELQALLNGRSVGELEAEATKRRAAASRLAADLDPEMAAIPLDPDTDAQVADLTEAADGASQELGKARGQLEERRRTTPDVPEAEEAVAAAEAELARIRALDETLVLTRRFLESAQDKVHRSIAPTLAAAVRRWLPHVTGGRYLDALVDPETLEVKVQGLSGRWRSAALLSHGVAEQIYLLLRVGMAEHLTRPGEICPLLLDDATAQCDRERKLAVLEALQTLSRERQVILFTQEAPVLAWAEASVVSPRDRLQLLDPPSIATA